MLRKKLEALSTELNEIIESLPNEDVVIPTGNEKILRIAALELGVKEVAGTGNNQRIVKYHAHAREDDDISKGQPDSVPWCSSFLCFVVEKAGFVSTNSMAARSWLKFGESTLKDPLPGDIVVYWRVKPQSWQGHVGVFLRQNRDGSIVTLGGNQGDEVNITTYSKDKLLDIRRVQDRSLDVGHRAQLLRLADDLINGRVVPKDGKVS